MLKKYILARDICWCCEVFSELILNIYNDIINNNIYIKNKEEATSDIFRLNCTFSFF